MGNPEDRYSRDESLTILHHFVDSLEWIFKINNPRFLKFSPNIPDRTLTFLYQFFESFEVDTDIDLLNNCLSIQTSIEVSFL